jgi:hypothetical protein
MLVFFAVAARLRFRTVLSLNLFVCLMIFGLTIFINYLCYRYRELYFLKLKDRFSIFKIGEF